MSNTNAANWVFGKRVFHWALAFAVIVALLAPKPDDGEGLVHVTAGAVALALVLVRLSWRLLGDVRPYLKDAWRLKLPDASKGARGLAPLLLQGARIGGFLFLGLVPIAAAFGLAGIGQGEDSPLLETHEAVGTAIMTLAIAHAVAAILFTVIIRYDLFRITLFGGARSFSEGGARGAWGIALGAALGAAALAYVWGPYDLATKVTALAQQEGGASEFGDDD